MNIAIVILNYNSYRETIECIESITEQDYPKDKIHVIVVDNASPDGSGDRLQNFIKKGIEGLAEVYYIKSKENLGFANGNNLGVLYAKHKLGIRNIIIVNSDTEFIDKELIKKFTAACQSGIGIIGCNILNADGENISRKRLELPGYRQIVYEDIRRRGYRYIAGHAFLHKLWRKVKKPRRYIPEKTGISEGKVWETEIADDIWLAGCGFMLTEEYFKHYPMLYPYTFMYCEEIILTLFCRKAGMKLAHLGEAELLHKDGKSTATVIDKTTEERFDQMKIWSESVSILRKVYRYDYKTIMRKFRASEFSFEKYCSFVARSF